MPQQPDKMVSKNVVLSYQKTYDFAERKKEKIGHIDLSFILPCKPVTHLASGPTFNL